MAKTKDLILCIDIGSDSIKAAEFSFTSGQGLVLERFVCNEFPASTEDQSDENLLLAIRSVIIENHFTAQDVYVTISGKNVFIRFAKIPAMTNDINKINEIISYEAKQAVPLKEDEIVWDSQIIASDNPENTEIDVMLVIVKKDLVTKISQLIESMHRHIALIEVAGTSIYNAARANNIGVSECQALLDIGGKCSTLIFLDGSRFFIRSISIGGDMITQQIAKEFNLSYEEAETLKRDKGFVALGGVYEEPDDEVAVAVSKVIRNVMTRLHSEVTRSVNLYRATQKGRKPERLFLSGGASIIPFAQNFFENKMGLCVEYFNPFQVVGIGSSVDQNLLGQTAHVFAQTIGLALRRIGTSPVEITLVPDHIKKQIAFRSKKIYFYSTCAVLLIYLGITYWAYHDQSQKIEKKRTDFSSFVQRKEGIQNRVKTANSTLQTEQSTYDDAVKLLRKRNNIIKFFSIFRECVPDNVWFTKLSLDSRIDSTISTALSDGKNILDSEAATAAAHGSTMNMTFTNDDSEEDMKKKMAEIEEKANAEAAASKDTGELKWINMTAYVICKKKETKTADRFAAVNNLMSRLKETGLFKDSDDEFQLVMVDDGNSTGELSISKFLLAVEFKAPLNSSDFENDYLFHRGGDSEESKNGKEDEE